jgi:hypothetical protein
VPTNEANRIMHRRLAKLRRLFTRSPADHVVLYVPKEGMEAEAAASWKDTGVCMACHRRAISCGRCVCCGATP